MKIAVIYTKTDIEKTRTGGARYLSMALSVLRRSHHVELYYPYFQNSLQQSSIHRLFRFLKMILFMRNHNIEADVYILDRRAMLFFQRKPKKRYIGILHHSALLAKRDYFKLLFNPKGMFTFLSTLWGVRRVDTVVTVSKYWQAYYRRLGCADARVIYNAFRVEEFSETELGEFRVNNNLLEDKPLVYIGNNHFQKGVLEVYNELKNRDYVLLTSGVKGTDLPVRHLELPYRDYLKLLAVSDVAIAMSSLPEGWCRTAHEALLMKTPVIGSGIAGMGELLTDAGQIVCRDIADLGTLVAGLIADKTKREQLGSEGYSFARKFTIERFESDWLALIDEKQVVETPKMKRFRIIKKEIEYIISRHIPITVKKGISKGMKLYGNASYNHRSETLSLEELFYQQIQLNGKIAIEAGAHIGIYTLHFARTCGAGKVICFEPNPDNFRILARNVKANSLTNVFLANSGLSDEEGEMKFVAKKFNSYTGTFDENRTESLRKSKAPVNEYILPLTTLDSYVLQMNLNSVDFVKIDTEGFEDRVIRGMSNTLKKFAPLLYFEVHANTGEEKKQKICLIAELLASSGFQMYTLENALSRILDKNFESRDSIPSNYVAYAPASRDLMSFVSHSKAGSFSLVSS